MAVKMTINMACAFAAMMLSAMVSAQQPVVAPKVEVQNDDYVKIKNIAIALTVRPDAEVGPVTIMNAVNNGPNFSLDLEPNSFAAEEVSR